MEFYSRRRQSAWTARDLPRCARPSSWPFGFGVLCLYCAIALGVSHSQALSLAVQAQQQPFPTDLALHFHGEDDTEVRPTHTFNLQMQATEDLEKWLEFRRLRDRGNWVRAFEVLEEINTTRQDGMSLAEDGFVIPFRKNVGRTMANMPAEGKRAFQLFYDATANQLLKRAFGSHEIRLLTQITDRYFITSAGPEAAIRLGDFYFEAGKFSDAANCYLTIADEHVSNPVLRATAMGRAAISQARAGNWAGFDASFADIQNRHAEAVMHVAGTERPLVDFLQEFKEKNRPAIPSRKGAQLPADLVMSASTRPSWRFRFPNPRDMPEVVAACEQNGWQPAMSTEVAEVAVDSDRLYAGFHGLHFAFDLKSGRMLWKSGKLASLTEYWKGGNFYYEQQYSDILAADGKLFSLFINYSSGESNYTLQCMNALTGELLWSPATTLELAAETLRGSLLWNAGTLYVTGAGDSRQHLLLFALDANTGKIKWKTTLGTSDCNPDDIYGMRRPSPQLAMHEGTIYVETHNGALVAVDAANGEIRWGYLYPSHSLTAGYNDSSDTKRVYSSRPVVENGVLYSKGMRSNRLVAIDVDNAKLVFSRPVPTSTQFSGLLPDGLLLTGSETLCVNRTGQKLTWFHPCELPSMWARPLVTQSQVHLYTHRGIFTLDSQTGNVISVIREGLPKSLGGRLIAANGHLVAVCNLQITVFPNSAGDLPVTGAPAEAAASITPADVVVQNLASVTADQK